VQKVAEGGEGDRLKGTVDTAEGKAEDVKGAVET